MAEQDQMALDSEGSIAASIDGWTERLEKVSASNTASIHFALNKDRRNSTSQFVFPIGAGDAALQDMTQNITSRLETRHRKGTQIRYKHQFS